MNKTQHAVLTLLGLLALAATGTSIGLTQHNAGLRRAMAEQQQYVQQSVQLEGLYREIIRALAELGARNNDQDVRALLQKHGIRYTVNPAVAAGPNAGVRK